MKGILMQAENIQLTLQGLKTQTRREVSAKTILACGGNFEQIAEKCKYKAGEIIYLKEPFYMQMGMNDFDIQKSIRMGGKCYYSKVENVTGRKRNALFMPALFARYYIEVKAVKVEWLHDISHKDIESEGIQVKDFKAAYAAYSELFTKVNKLAEFPNKLVYVIDFELINYTEYILDNYEKNNIY